MPVSEFTKRVLARAGFPEEAPRKETPRTDFVNRVLINAGVRTPEEQQRRITETARVAEEARIEAEKKGGFLGIIRGAVKRIGEIGKKVAEFIDPATLAEQKTEERFKQAVAEGKSISEAKEIAKSKILKDFLNQLSIPTIETKVTISDEGKTKIEGKAIELFGISFVRDITKKLGFRLLKKIAKSVKPDEIFSILKGKFRGVSDSALRETSERLKGVTDIRQVQQEVFEVVERAKPVRLARVAKEVVDETGARPGDWALSREEYLTKYPDVINKQPWDMSWIEAEKVFVQGKLAKSKEFADAKRAFEATGLDIAGKEGRKAARLVENIDKAADREISELLIDSKTSKKALAKLNEYRGVVKPVAPVAEVTPRITPELEPLAKEARKFKTAEEFVKKVKETNLQNREIKQIPIKDIDFEFGIAKRDFAKAQKEIAEGVVRPISKEPIRAQLNLTTGKFEVIDGYHRLASAINKGDKTISAGIEFSTGKLKGDEVSPFLTDFFNKVKGVVPEVPKVPTEKLPAKITAQTPTPEPRTVPTTQAVEVSGASKVDSEIGKVYRRTPDQTPNFIAMRTMKDGRKIPAIREASGVYAPKEFEVFEFKPLKGLVTGPRAVSMNFRDAALSIDGITPRQAAERGNWGPMVQTWYKHETALASRFTYVGTKAATVRSLAQKNGVRVNKKTGEQLFEALEGKTEGIPKEIIRLSKELREQVLNLTRKDANVIRKQLGKKEIGFLTNYAPHMQEVNFWRNMLTDARTTITDNFDFIIPNAKKNPHALPRLGQLQDLETNAWKLIESYIDNLSNDIFISPQIEQLKAIGSVFKGREQFGMGKFLDDYVRNNLVGKPGQLDSLLGITEGTIVRNVLQKLNMARNISALAFNMVWTVFVQPASIVLTLARGGGITRGIQNTLKGFVKFAFSTERTQRVKKLPTLIIKTKGASLGMTGAGDLDRMAGKIFKTRIESFNDVVGKIADGMEYWLTGGSMSTGYEEATKLGLKGESADIFANWLGGATQSSYNKEARTMIQNNLVIRSGFPFSTYAFEVWRFAKTLIGAKGGMPLEKSERLNQAIMFMAGAYLYNQYLEKVTGRKIFTVGSGVPIVGGILDEGIYQGKVALGVQATTRFGRGRAPVAPAEDVTNLIKALGNFVNDGNLAPMRKELTKWGMGFSGLAGASTINRFIDGMVASTQGYMTTRKGEPVFIIEGADKFIAPLLGPYSTEAGKKYLKQQEIRDREQRRVMPIYEESQALLEEGLNEKAQELVDSLSADDWKIYKKIKTKDKAEQKSEGVRAMIPFVQEAEELLEQGKDEEAQRIVDDLTEEEYEWYQGAKNKLEKLRQAKEGVKPSFLDGEIIDDRTLIEITFTYAEALGVAPIDALKAIFEGETIRRVDNRTIVVFRMPFTESQAIRTEWADGRELSTLRLDHTIPLQLGGLNAEDNLRLIPTEIWKASTPIENHLGRLLRDNKIEKKEARQLILDYKEGRISASEILSK